MKYLKIILLSFSEILIFFCIHLYAQESLKDSDPDKEYKKGLELFENSKFGAAQKSFDDVIANYGELNSDIKTNAEFYSALCAIELFNGDAEYLISGFISKYPESSMALQAFFEMGKFRYRQEKYDQAIQWFEKVDKDRLPREYLPEYYFKLGYSYFINNQYDKASLAFFEIKDVDTKYTAPAVYYYSHIAYVNKNYETALQGFKRLTEDETFSSVVPYYITQILYFQRKYDEVISFAPKFLESASTKRTPEIARIIGQSYYRKKMYKEALPYLKTFDEKASNKTREDKYELAYTYYLLADYPTAAEMFSVITGEQDTLSQNAYYHLADCYLKAGDKDKARLAFSAASKMDFDKIIKEDALFNYAKITFEQKYNPFNDAIEALNDYISEFPGTARTDEAYNYLTIAYMNTRNYKDALESIGKISLKDTRINEAYQRIAYFRGIELFNNLDYKGAIDAFNKSLANSSYDKTLKAKAIYWIGESYYRLNKYTDAISKYNEFLLTPGAFGLDEFYTAHYNIGYCYFRKKNYSDALTWFRKYANLTSGKSTRYTADNNNRIGDCFFTQRNYSSAVEFYGKTAATKTNGSDYALFQKAFSLGLLEKTDEKISTLEKMIKEYPSSNLYDDALYELASAYLKIHNLDKAASNYLNIVQNYPSASYVRKSLLQLGLIYYNQNRFDDALKYYKKVVADFPDAAEATNAMVGIKNIYVELNKVDDYFAYAEKVGRSSEISVSEQDSLTYTAAEKAYLTGDCNATVKNFDNYLKKFPNGNFIINATYYQAECEAKLKNTDQAISLFENIISKPKNTFTEHSLLSLAKLYFEKENYEKAYETYASLDRTAELLTNLVSARIGVMRSAEKLKDNNKLTQACDNVLLIEQLSPELVREAHYYKALGLFQLNHLYDALAEYRVISVETATNEGAEANYMIPKIYFMLNKLKQSQDEVMKFISKGTSYQYWLGKSFILLADIYQSNNDAFQAKATLQSLVDNYKIKDDGIIDEANLKLSGLVEKEQQQQYGEKEEDIKLQFKENKNGKYDKLFDEKNKAVKDTVRNK